MSNKIGWIIAGVLVLSLIAFVVFKSSGSNPTPPTPDTANPEIMEYHPLNASPSLFLPSGRLEGPGNAGEDYVKAIALYKANAQVLRDELGHIDQIPSRTYTPKGSSLQLIRDILAILTEAGAKKDMKYALVCTPKEFIVKGTYRPGDDLARLVGLLSVLNSTDLLTKNYASMEKSFQASFTAGWHMMAERSRARMMLDGIILQETALNDLESLYNLWQKDQHPQQLAGIAAYQKELSSLRVFVERKCGIIWKNPPEPGDLYRIIENDKDRVFRVDSLLYLGAVRYTHAKFPADLKKIASLLDQYEKSADPFEAAAATAAKKLTPEDFRQVGAPDNDD